jgi:hypothetical protein
VGAVVRGYPARAAQAQAAHFRGGWHLEHAAIVHHEEVLDEVAEGVLPEVRRHVPNLRERI